MGFIGFLDGVALWSLGDPRVRGDPVSQLWPERFKILDFEGLPPNMSVISHELVALEQQQRFRPT